jgi:hypothetical protein
MPLQRVASATMGVVFVIAIAAIVAGVGAGAFISSDSSYSGVNQVQSPACKQYSCIYFQINSDSSITGISVSISPEPSSCLQGLVCTPVGASCGNQSNFCTDINTQARTAAFSFQGVEQGYYWLDFNANLGNNASRGTVRTIHVSDRTAYYITANITAGLATAEIKGA